MDYYLLGGTIVSIAFFAIFLMSILFRNREFKFWHGIAVAVAGLFTASMVQNHVQLTDWVALGVAGTCIGASIFLYGMLAFIGVMVFNFVASRGKTLIR